MAQLEPMDVDNMASDFDDKENTLHNSNVLPKTPSTEKGYEELDVSELNMKLRYSITPANSPMSRSYTANYRGDSGPNSLNNTVVIDSNLTRSLNSTVTKTDVFKSPKLPLQALPTSRNTNSDRRLCDKEGNITVTISGTDNDDNLSLPSTSSSAVQTPEATTPTKEIPKSEGSPIMRGLKSVLNMFRSSQSPVPPSEDDDVCYEKKTKDGSSHSFIIASTLHDSNVKDNSSSKQTSEIVPINENPCPETPAKEKAVMISINPQLVCSKPLDNDTTPLKDGQSNPLLSSTPISNSKIKDSKESSKRNSPLKESIVFNEDLERELKWQEETEIFFKNEKIPIQKQLFQTVPLNIDSNPKLSIKDNDMGKLNTNVEYMDVSNANVSYKTVLEDKTLNDIKTNVTNNEMSCVESDNEFVDCETTYTQNKSYILETAQENKILPVVFQVDKLPHEAYLEEYIKTVNESETNDFIFEKPPDELKNTEASGLTELNNSSEPPIEITNKAFSGVIEIPNSLSEFSIKDTHDDLIINVGNIIVDSVPPTKKSCTTEAKEATHQTHIIETNSLSLDKYTENDVTPAENIVDCIPNVIENSIATIQSYTQQSVEDSNTLQMIIQTSNQVHESCVKKIHNIKDSKKPEIEVSIPVPNLPTNNMIMNGEYAITADTDDTNTTRILFEIDELLLNKIKLANFEKDTVSNNTETSATECKKASVNTSLNTSEDYLPDKSRAIDETVVSNNDNAKGFDEEIVSSANNSPYVSVSEIDLNSNFNLPADKSEILPEPELETVGSPLISPKLSRKRYNINFGEIENPFATKTNIRMSPPLEILNKSLTSVNNNQKNIHVQKRFPNRRMSQPEGKKPDASKKRFNTSVDREKITICNKTKKSSNKVCNIHTKENKIDVASNIEDIKKDTNPYITKSEVDLSHTLTSVKTSSDLGKNTVLQESNEKIISAEKNLNNQESRSVFDIPEIDDMNFNPFVTKSRICVTPPPIELNDNLNATNHSEILTDPTIENKYNAEQLNATVCINSLNESATVGTEYGYQNEAKICSAKENKIDVALDIEDINPSNMKSEVDYSHTLTSVKTSLDSGNHTVLHESNEKIISAEENLKKNQESRSVFNISEIDDMNFNPFATKSRICVTPPPTELNDNLNVTNHSEILTDPTIQNKYNAEQLNATVCINNLNERTTGGTECGFQNEVKVCSAKENKIDVASNIEDINPYIMKSEVDYSHTLTSVKTSSDSGNHTVLHESNEKIISAEENLKNNQESRSVFNIPEIDDMNLNPLTKSRIYLTPPPTELNDALTDPTIENKYNAEQLNATVCINNLNERATGGTECGFQNEVKICSAKENKIDVASNIEDINPHIMKSEVDYSHTLTSVKTSSDSGNHTVLHESNEKIISAEENLKNNQESRSVFNIPEIDDMNLNPFTKSRIYLTPSPTEINDALTDPTIENKYNAEQLNATVCINSLNESATVGIECGFQNEDKICSDASNVTSSSINTEGKDVTVREVNTEDEDTIEGPFFEAEDLDDVVKVPEIEIEKDTMQLFEDLPTSSNNDDIDKGELFIDAEAFEFLLNQNKSNVVADSGKESLFLKFDPLFAKRVSSDGVLAALSSMQKKQSTPKKLPRTPLAILARDETPTVPMAGPSNVASIPEVSNEETISTKPMMVVSPAIAKQPVATPRISLTPKINRHSLSFSSPAMVVIDRLLSLSGNTSLLDQDASNDGNRNHEANIVLVQLRELLAEKELYVHSLKCESKELSERLTTLESQVRSLENEGEERLKKVNTLNERLAEVTKINKSIAVVVEEYERTIASLIAEKEQEKKRNAEERMRLITERDEQTAHLASMEGSFSDLHSKYEKCKQIILNMKANEDSYKKSFKEFDENLRKMQKNYDLLKQHATSKLNHANQELEKMNRAHDAEVLKLTSIIKRKDLHITSLEESLVQKSKANEELAAICDELINKVG